jgi:hypothetical protein
LLLSTVPRSGRRIGYVVCVQPVTWPEPDPQIAAAIAAKYPGRRPRPLAVQVRDRPAPLGRKRQLIAELERLSGKKVTLHDTA